MTFTEKEILKLTQMVIDFNLSQSQVLATMAFLSSFVEDDDEDSFIPMLNEICNEYDTNGNYDEVLKDLTKEKIL